MKLVFTTVLLSLISTLGWSATAQLCENKEKTFKILAVSKYDGTPDTLTVQYKNKIVFKDVPVVQWNSGMRIDFISLNFKSSAGAPSSLHLLMYPNPKGGNYLGEFSMISYQPDVPSASVECIGKNL